MRKKCVTIHRRGRYSQQDVASAALELRESADGPTALAFAFVTPDYAPHIEEFSELVRVDGHVIELIGATGAGLTVGGEENEEGGGFAMLALSGQENTFEVVAFNQSKLEESTDSAFWRKLSRATNPSAWIALANPFNFDTERWLAEWNAAWPDVPCIGGLASGTSDGEGVGVFHNGRFSDAVVVAVTGMRVMAVVSQGCRPIGEPLTVTRAESNVVYSLGARPAYEALESAFEGLTEGEKAGAKGNLFAGLAGTEYVDEFKPGDFLIRNILGADPNSGAVAIGGYPRVGQTLQYQLRDRKAADAEWRSVLRTAAAESGKAPLASLLFACTGRGSRLFGSKGHDAGLLEDILGAHASAGFFCNGEIGPLGGRNYIHSYSATGALFFDQESEPSE
ncbi:MAG TPA: FIST N-terminal domain-containing protein [Terrimicrobiaceae bacterium]|nr:FIST N-terminal domain-containing protein [Terrimicrobiaceae bacterium]